MMEMETVPLPPLPLKARGKTSGRGRCVKAIINEWRCLRKSDSPAWDKIIGSLAAEIKVRHYSRKTLKAYPDYPDAPRSQRCSHDHDLYPLCPGQDSERGQKSAGFLMSLNCM